MAAWAENMVSATLRATVPRSWRSSCMGGIVALAVPDRTVKAVTNLGSPAAVDPFLQMWGLGPDRRVVAVARQDTGAGGQAREKSFDRADDRGEVAALELRVARTAGEQRVAAEQDR